MKKSRRFVLFLLGGGAALLLIAGLVVILFFGRPSFPPLPNPNGYDDLIRAGQAVRGNFGDLANADNLRTVVATNADALRLLRAGLARNCSVPTAAVIANFGGVSGDLIALKSLAKLLNAEGRLAEAEDRPLDAAQSYLDAMQLGDKMSHGGLMIHRLVGIASQGIGTISFVKLLPKLTCDQMRPLISQLEQIDGETVAWEEVLKNEDRFARAQLGNFPNPIQWAVQSWNARTIRKACKDRNDLATARLRLLAVELAIRCFRCEEGIAPPHLQHLLPKYLHRMPTDPFTGLSLVYKQTGTNWLLYSVGSDRVDDGGKPRGRTASSIGLDDSESASTPKNKGDVLYDSPW